MSRPVKIILGVSLSLITIIVAIFFFFRYQIQKSFPEYEGDVVVSRLNKNVKIYRDNYGIPYIFAENEHDLMFIAGYVHAQDRLWQMDLFRRTAEGRLSEVFGEKTFEIDKMFRTLNFSEVCRKIENSLPDDVTEAMNAYAAGINFYIYNSKGKYPVEFDMLGYEPYEWKIKHSLLLSRLMAWDLNFSWWVDLTFGRLAEKVDLQKAVEAFPAYSDKSPAIVESEKKKSVFKNIPVAKIISSAGLTEVYKSYKDFFGTGGWDVGSNSWVIGAELSKSGMPILANDPHLELPSPSKWYEVYFSAPGWNVSGFTIPGSPFIIIGQNENISWGLTNAMIDETDFYIEMLDSTTTGNYIFNNKSMPMKIRKEIIYIGKKDSVEYEVRETHNGPVISDIHPSKSKLQFSDKKFEITMRWLGFETSNEPEAFYNMNKAKNRKEFEEGVKLISVPGQNIIFADTNGNIGYWLTAKVPVRAKVNPIFPLPGWTDEYQWKGFVPFEKLPRLLNPKEGFIATANNKIIDSYPEFISNLYMPPSRIIRIRELLTSIKKFDVTDFQNIQLDYLSPHSRDLTHLIIQVYEAKSVTDPEIVQGLDYLKNWDYKHEKTDIATSIFNTFLIKFIGNVFRDEMGEDLFSDYVQFSALPLNALDNLITSGNSVWFDNIETEEIETMEVILQQSMAEAIKELQMLFGKDTKDWQWGNLHTVTFRHPLGRRTELEKIFNVGPFPFGGSISTVNVAAYRLNKPFESFVGPSMRMIVDMSKPLEKYSINTTGQSGQPLHEYYKDQTLMWRNGEYKRVTMVKDEIVNSGWKMLECYVF